VFVKIIHFTCHVYTHYLVMLHLQETRQNTVLSDSFYLRSKTKTIIRAVD